MKIFSQSRAPQCLPRILLDKLVKGFLALFPGRKKCKDPAHPGVGTGCRVELMDAVSLAGVSSVAQHGVRLLILVAAKQEWCFLVCSSGPPSYPVAWSSCWCRLCLATRPSWRLLEEFPLLRALCRAIRTWKSGLYLRPCVFQSFGVWLLLLEYVVFGTRALLGSTVDPRSSRGFWRTSHIFYVWCTQTRGVPLHSAEWRSVQS